MDFFAESFLLGSRRTVWERLRNKEAFMMQQIRWIRRWKTWLAPTRLPGVWKRKEGGYLVRARATDPTTGNLVEIKRVLPEADEATAYKWLEDERAQVRRGIVVVSQRMRFAEFAASLFEHKVKVGDIRSPKGRDRWRCTLVHLISGTYGKKAEKRVKGFGAFFLDAFHLSHVEEWKEGIAELIASGDYSPTTANGWLAILRVIMKAAKRRVGLPDNPMEDVKDFDTSEHATYTEEEPNALRPEEAPAFLASMRALHPQHYAMTYLGFVTGLRPSQLRPLRRKGPQADVLWERNRILVRRSQTVGNEVMNTTKQKHRYPIDVPEDVMAVLRWHVETQLHTPEQQDSELLFPAVGGGFRAPSVLNKPFAEVAEEIGLGKAFTQRGLRRTFNDLARAARVQAIVTRSISGHLTEQMQDHYSTVDPREQREGIAKVIDLMKFKATGVAAATGGAPGGAPGAPSGAPKEKAGEG
jgi:integrase